MRSHADLMNSLRGIDAFLNMHPQSHRPARFEELVTQAFARILHLNFFDAGSDDEQIQHRVTWHGTVNPLRKAGAHRPDATVRAHQFYVVVEATLKRGTKQWSQEFSRCLDHARAVAEEVGAALTNVFVALVMPTLHQDTFRAVRAANPESECKIVPLELDALALAVQTAGLAFTIRHLEVRKLLHVIMESLGRCRSPVAFREQALSAARAWQKEVLELEKRTVVAIRSYQAMLKTGRHYVGVSEIEAGLIADPSVVQYFQILQGEPDSRTITDSLISESLGKLIEKSPINDEELFCPVPLSDFKSRCARRQAAVEQANA